MEETEFVKEYKENKELLSVTVRSISLENRKVDIVFAEEFKNMYEISFDHQDSNSDDWELAQWRNPVKAMRAIVNKIKEVAKEFPEEAEFLIVPMCTKRYSLYKRILSSRIIEDNGSWIYFK